MSDLQVILSPKLSWQKRAGQEQKHIHYSILTNLLLQSQTMVTNYFLRSSQTFFRHVPSSTNCGVVCGNNRWMCTRKKKSAIWRNLYSFHLNFKRIQIYISLRHFVDYSLVSTLTELGTHPPKLVLTSLDFEFATLIRNTKNRP